MGIPLRYLLKHPVTGIADLAADPIEIWTTIREAYAEKHEERRPQCLYEPDLSCVPWPCDEAPEFWELWHQVIGELEA
jgi:hypothetical protein